MTKFSKGAFVFTRIRGLQPRGPAELEPLAIHHCLDPSVIPNYSGDRVAIMRAITHASRGLSKEGTLLRPIKRTSTKVIYGIVQEKKDESHQRLDHEFEDVITWAAEPNPAIVTGDHKVAQGVRDAYRQLRSKIVSDDWSASITSYLESHDSARMRGDGRVYWVPPQRIEEVKKLGAFLAEIGIDLILCEIEPEVQTVVQDVAQVSIDEELDRLQEEAKDFDGKQKPSTYSRRLEEFQRLRQRAVLYKDALGVGADRASQVLDELEEKVTYMLELRKKTVIHRDGSISSSPEISSSPVSGNIAGDPPVKNTGRTSHAPTCVKFAGAQFTLQNEDPLTYISDDEAAKSSVATLESMGLAGSWQQAGPAKIRIQNSGPPGADVSLCIQLPDERSLVDSATSLASWGIELAS